MNGLSHQCGELRRRVQMLLRGRRFEQDLDEEVQFHLELRAKQYEHDGHTPADAKRRAAERFGPALMLREDARTAWGWRWLDELRQDVAYGVRVMRRDAVVTTIVVATLALAIGMASAMFGVLDTVLLRPLPYRDSDAIALLWTANAQQGLREIGTGYPIVEQWRALSRTFDDVAVCSRTHPVTVPRADTVERVPGAVVSANLFSLLGIPPMFGRTISPDDEVEHRRVVVVSAGFWKERLGASPSVIGTMLNIDGESAVVVGVMPEAFQFPSKETVLWEPMTSLRNWEASRTYPYSHFWMVVGRLRPETTFAAAQSDMNAVGRQVAAMFPPVDTFKSSSVSFDVNVVPLHLQLVNGRARAGVWMLFGAVMLVLLIACSNVANLLLAKGAVRRRELAVRTALGGGRSRLVRQLMTEAVLLAAVGGALGVVVAGVAMRLFVSLGSATIPQLVDAALDLRVLAFALAISMLAAVAFGLLPALEASADAPGEGLKDGGRSAGTRTGRRARGLLIITEFALALVLLAGSALLVRSLLETLAVPTGFRAERVLVARVEYPRGKSDASALAFYRDAVERVERLPGVEAAGLVSRFVIDTNPDDVITVEGREPVPNEQLWDDSITPGYFRAAGSPLLRGRTFLSTDARTSPAVAIINETMARRFWANEDPLGRRFKMGAAQGTEPWITIVGIVADMRRQGLERAPISQIFVPHAQSPGPGMLREVDFLVRTVSDPLASQSLIRGIFRDLDPTVPVSQVTTLERQIDRWRAPRRFQTAVLTGFSLLALVLASIGIYGLLHYSVAQRTREIGIRMALGAGRPAVLRAVVAEGLILAGAGAALGLIGVVALGRVLRDLLFQVSPADPASVVAAVAVLALAAAVGCILPARRATAVDPLVALRSD